MNTRLHARYLFALAALALPRVLLALDTNPADGAIDVPTSTTVTWPSTPGASAYYLYIGSQVGFKDVANSGEIAAPSFAVQLPTAQRVYARLWTRLNQVWTSSDISFTTSSTASTPPPTTATLLTPAPAIGAVPQSFDLNWTAVLNAQAYYVYVGSQAGTKDLANSGELQSTTYHVASVPLESTIYVRLWTRVSGIWRSIDYSYFVAGLATPLTTPQNNQQNFDPGTSFAWLALFGAEKYYLYVGTTPGLKDVVNSGETTATSWPSPAMPGGRTFYVSMYTRAGGVWRVRESSFQTAAYSTLITPANGQTDANPMPTFAWSAVDGAQAYYLYVGTTVGAKDLVNSGETLALTLAGKPLPGGQVVYARIWTRINNAWQFRDTSFTTRPSPRFISPRSGETNVGGSTTLRWTTVVGASNYTLTVGTSPGAADVLPPSVTSQNELAVSGLPSANALYGRVSTRVNGQLAIGDVVFSPKSSVAAARTLRPASGGSLAAGTSIQWSSVGLARAYQLQIGSAPGGSEILDSGEINVTERFVEAVPVGVTLYGTLTTHFLVGPPYKWTFTFVKASNGMPFQDKFSAATAQTATIRLQAIDNAPAPNSALSRAVADLNKDFANCVDYSNALRQYIKESGLSLVVRNGSVCLVPNSYDCHTFVEVQNEVNGDWNVLDPTFGLTMTRATDGLSATSQDISNATRQQRWSDIDYLPLTQNGFAYADAYYIDYPLLYVHVYDPLVSFILGDEQSVLPYYDVITGPLDAQHAVPVALGCAAGSTSVSAIVDSVPSEVPCEGVDNLSMIFTASSVHLADESTGEILTRYHPRRYVFGLN